jgi:hypothetical protein
MGELTMTQAQTPVKESPEGWRAWPLWLRIMIIVIVFIIVAGIIAIASSIPSQARNIQIVGAPDVDFIAYVIAYHSSSKLFVPAGDNMGQAERVCIGIDLIAFGDMPPDTDYIALATQTIGVTLNEIAVPPEDMAFAFDPTIISRVDSAGQSLGDGHGTVGICVRTESYPAGDYIVALTILRPDNSTRFYDLAVTIG